MSFFVSLAVLDIALPFGFTYIFYKHFKKYLWYVPLIALVIMGGLFMLEILTLYHGGSLIDTIAHYLSQDWSMSLFFFYLPNVVVCTLFTIIFYIYDYIRNKAKHR